MSKSLKDAESLHTDQHDPNAISPVVNSSDEAGQKIEQALDNSYHELAKRVSENLETSSNSPSSTPEIVKRCNKERQQKSKSRQEKRKRSLPHPHSHPFHHPVRPVNQKMK